MEAYQKEKKSLISFSLVAELMFLTLTVLADMMVVDDLICLLCWFVLRFDCSSEMLDMFVCVWVFFQREEVLAQRNFSYVVSGW